MAAYKETLRANLDIWPELFVDEADVLHHLFFVNGNGYDWIGGQLVSIDAEDLPANMQAHLEEHKARLRAQMAAEPDFMQDFFRSELRLLDLSPAERRAHELRDRIARCDRENKLAGLSSYTRLEDGSLAEYLYPLCEYAKVCNLPDDIQPDWLEAAEKAVSLVGTKLLHKDKDRTRNEQWLAVAVARIKELKGLL